MTNLAHHKLYSAQKKFFSKQKFRISIIWPYARNKHLTVYQLFATCTRHYKYYCDKDQQQMVADRCSQVLGAYVTATAVPIESDIHHVLLSSGSHSNKKIPNLSTETVLRRAHALKALQQHSRTYGVQANVMVTFCLIQICSPERTVRKQWEKIFHFNNT